MREKREGLGVRYAEALSKGHVENERYGYRAVASRCCCVAVVLLEIMRS